MILLQPVVVVVASAVAVNSSVDFASLVLRATAFVPPSAFVVVVARRWH